MVFYLLIEQNWTELGTAGYCEKTGLSEILTGHRSNEIPLDIMLKLRLSKSLNH